MIHLDLFSGIGGFSLAADWVWGKENIQHIFCDNEPFSQAILKKHWPGASIFGDIRTVTYAGGAELRGVSGDGRKEVSALGRGSVYLLTGGFPCQPFSQAGRRKGTADDRHLWPEMLRLIHETKPRWVVGENVAGFITWSDGLVFRQVLADLEGEGYEVQAFVIPAVALNAPHRRDRVWIVGHNVADAGHSTRRAEQEQQQGERPEVNDRGNAFSDAPNTRQQYGSAWDKQRVETNTTKRTARPTDTKRQDKNAPNTEHPGLERGKCEARTRQRGLGDRVQHAKANDAWNQNWLEVATRLCSLDDGLPGGLARPRGWRNAALKGAGNAIVPQVVAEIFKAIKEIDGNF